MAEGRNTLSGIGLWSNGKPEGEGASLIRQPHVLVVEPDLLVQGFIRTALEELGIVVVAATNATEARACLRRAPIELAIVEMMLRRTSGDKLAQQIWRRGIPVVVMSGHEEGLRKANATGFPVLTKPFRVKKLLEAVILNIESWTPQQH